MKLASLESIVRALAQREVRYLIVGGLAVAAHGVGRATFDIDVVLKMQPENVLKALSALQSLGYRPTAPVDAKDLADEAVRETWIREKRMIVLQLQSDLHPETTIDLFVDEPFDFDHEYANALVGDLLPGVTMRFPQAATLIRMKEATGRAKDAEDARLLRKLGGGSNAGA